MVVVMLKMVKEPNKTGWKILVRIIKYLSSTKKHYLTLRDVDLKMIKWYVDASFAVHPDFNIHTRYILTIVQVVMQSFIGSIN